MGFTITEKILGNAAGKPGVKAGELIFAKLNLVMSTDVTTPPAAVEFEKMGADKVFNNEKIALVNDHFVPAKDIKAAELSKATREFAYKYGIKNYFEVGRSGICHQIVPDSGLVLPGDTAIGADSHTCTYGAVGAFATGVGATDLAAAWALGETWFKVPETIKVVYKGKLPEYVCGKDLILRLIGDIGVDGALYKALEFTGEVVSRLPMADRITLCNMAIEAGGKSGIIEPDDITEEYVKPLAKREFRNFKSDSDAVYFKTVEYDVTAMEPLVALPFLPSNVKPVSQVGDIRIDQVVIGSCTNGRIEDFRIFANIIKGKKINPAVRVIAIPGHNGIIREMIKEGIFDQLLDAGIVVGPPTCGPCIGGHMGVMASGERTLSTTNRNFKGRMGPVDSEIYLASPAVAAATALAGKIADPRDFV